MASLQLVVIFTFSPLRDLNPPVPNAQKDAETFQIVFLRPRYFPGDNSRFKMAVLNLLVPPECQLLLSITRNNL